MKKIVCILLLVILAGVKQFGHGVNNKLTMENLKSDPSNGTGYFLRAQNSVDGDTIIFRYKNGTLKRWISE